MNGHSPARFRSAWSRSLAKDPETSVAWCRKAGICRPGGRGANSAGFCLRARKSWQISRGWRGCRCYCRWFGSRVAPHYVRGPGATGRKRAGNLRRSAHPIYMALGTLSQTIAELVELFGGGGGLTLSRMAAMLAVAENQGGRNGATIQDRPGNHPGPALGRK